MPGWIGQAAGSRLHGEMQYVIQYVPVGVRATSPCLLGCVLLGCVGARTGALPCSYYLPLCLSFVFYFLGAVDGNINHVGLFIYLGGGGYDGPILLAGVEPAPYDGGSGSRSPQNFRI